MNPAATDPGAGWDCHVHVFDAAQASAGAHYRPVRRDLADIEALASAHALHHLVLVQPSVYGTDNRLLLQALAREPGRHRAVVVIDRHTSEAELDQMHALGVRGVRFNRVSPVGNGPADFAALAPRLRARGWHVQWYAHAAQLAEVAALHQGSGLVAVLDHLAGLGAHTAPGDPAWQALGQLADQGAWVKLSGWYRLQATAPYEALLDTVRRVAEAVPQRLVWGSDWPHTAFSPEALPAYASVWQPVVRALGEAEAARVRCAGARLYR
jgi:predicted TIM-barrel fold metal-dependent hydrolase